MSNYDPNYVHQKVYCLVGQKAVLVDTNGKILLLQRSNKSGSGGKWSLPGGAIELGENTIDGIKREIKEELNIDVEKVSAFASRSYTNKKNDFVIIIGYICSDLVGEIQLNWEHDAFVWTTKENALNLDLTDDGRFFIESYEPNGN